MGEHLRPAPTSPDPLFTPYLDALRRGELAMQDCGSEGLQWPPREMCLKSGDPEPAWTTIAATGTVYSFTVSYRAFHPFFADKTPVCVAVVELESGVRMLGGWAGAPEALACGVRVAAAPRVEDGVPLLYWTPAEAAA